MYDSTPYNPTEARSSDKNCERKNEGRAQARIDQGLADHLIHGAHLRNRKLRIERSDLLLHRHRELQRLRRGVHSKHVAVAAPFKDREIHGRLRLLADLVQGVADHAHDFIIDIAGRSLVEMRRNVEVLADGIVPGEVLPHKLTAHNHLVGSRAAFVVGEGPAAHKRESRGR